MFPNVNAVWVALPSENLPRLRSRHDVDACQEPIGQAMGQTMCQATGQAMGQATTIPGQAIASTRVASGYLQPKPWMLCALSVLLNLRLCPRPFFAVFQSATSSRTYPAQHETLRSPAIVSRTKAVLKCMTLHFPAYTSCGGSRLSANCIR